MSSPEGQASGERRANRVQQSPDHIANPEDIKAQWMQRLCARSEVRCYICPDESNAGDKS